MTAPRPASLDEEQLVAYYLVHRHSHPRCSQVRPEHLRDPVLRAGWERALAREDWTDTELGIPLDRLVELSDRYVSAALLPALERRLVQEWSRRRLVTAGGAVLQDLAKGADLEQTVASLRELLGETEAGSLTASRPLGDVMQQVITEWVDVVTSKTATRTIPLPLPTLQRRLGGWVRGKLHVVGGRSKEHKTTLLRMSAWYPAEWFKTCFINLEDRDTDLASRGIAAEVPEFSFGALITGLMPEGFPNKDPERYAELIQRVEALCTSKRAQNMRAIDFAGITLPRLLGFIRAEAARGVQLFLIDYVQLVQHERGNDRDTEFWSRLSAGLHDVAKETNAAIVASAQIDKTEQRHTDAKGIPEASGILYGQGLKRDAFAMVMVGKPNRTNPDSRAYEIVIDKWKSGPTFRHSFIVDPVHDLIQEGWGPHERTAA